MTLRAARQPRTRRGGTARSSRTTRPAPSSHSRSSGEAHPEGVDRAGGAQVQADPGGQVVDAHEPEQARARRGRLEDPQVPARVSGRPARRRSQATGRRPPQALRAAVIAARRSAISATATLPSSPSPWRRTATVPSSASRSPTTSM